MNQKFGTNVIGKDLKVKGGYKPGSNLSRQLVGFSNLYWAKKIASAVGGGILGKAVTVLSAEQVTFNQVQSLGAMSTIGPLTMQATPGKGAVICVNPGGEETWDRLYNALGSKSGPFVILNNAYSTTYDLGNKRGYEEAYYLKRVSKGWVYRSFPGPWQAYLETRKFYATAVVCLFVCFCRAVTNPCCLDSYPFLRHSKPRVSVNY